MYPRGSEWRRWDLHVHTPDTILNNQFGTWDEYLTAVEAHPTVKVMGITDYMTITNYQKLQEFKAYGRLPNIVLLIPNIEFRIAPPTEKATAVNIHLLICPDDPNHEQETLNALGRLHWRYGTGNYSCVPEQLKALGRAFDPSIRDDRVALRVGVTQFKVDFSKFREWYDGEQWLRQSSLVAVDAGDTGLSGFQRDGAWAATRDEITRFSQILFSGRAGEREFWLGEGTDENRETVKRLGGPKPCVQGSDAHDITRLFNPTQDRFCWIKADPTFEGLRQILYEPKDRVYVGPSPPVYYDEARVIRKVKLRNANGWFDDVEIPLNSSLVSIIGQKAPGNPPLPSSLRMQREAGRRTALTVSSPEPTNILRAWRSCSNKLTVPTREQCSGIARLKKMGSDTCPRSLWSGCAPKTVSGRNSSGRSKQSSSPTPIRPIL
jgi:hypothetical protein